MIIDVHGHLGSLGVSKAVPDQLVRLMDRAGIDKIVVSHIDAIFYDMRAGNDALGAAIRAFPDRISGYASFTSAYFGQAVIDEIDRCVQEYGMRGVKIYSANKRSVGEPDLFPIVQHAGELGLPVLAHAFPQEIKVLAEACPKTQIIVAHLGEGSIDTNMWQLITVAKAHANVILDLTASQIYAGEVEACVAAVGPERVVFGTDLPLLEPEVQLEKVYAADIDDTTRRLILGGNAARLFGLHD